MTTIKKKLLIFSECSIYGGSERLMKSIYDNNLILSEYEVYFAYSSYKLYRNSLLNEKLRFNNRKNFIGLRLNKIFLIRRYINANVTNKFFKFFFKVLINIIDFTLIPTIWNYLIFFKLLKNINPHIIHINNGGYPASSACNQLAHVLNFKKNIKVIYQINGEATVNYKFIYKINDFFVNKSVHHFFTHSKRNIMALEKRNLDISKFSTFPSFFYETQPQIIKKENLFYLCMVGFLSKRKGQIKLLEALVEIKKNNIEIYNKLHIDIIGDGDLRNEIVSFISNYNINDKVTLHGNKIDYLNYIANCDIFILPSQFDEDLPLVLLSALKLKKPIIASDFGGISEYLTNEFDSILIDHNSNNFSKDLANKIILLYNNYEFKEQISHNTEQTNIKFFSEYSYSNNLIKLYEN